MLFCCCCCCGCSDSNGIRSKQLSMLFRWLIAWITPNESQMKWKFMLWCCKCTSTTRNENNALESLLWSNKRLWAELCHCTTSHMIIIKILWILSQIFAYGTNYLRYRDDRSVCALASDHMVSSKRMPSQHCYRCVAYDVVTLSFCVLCFYECVSHSLISVRFCILNIFLRFSHLDHEGEWDHTQWNKRNVYSLWVIKWGE